LGTPETSGAKRRRLADKPEARMGQKAAGGAGRKMTRKDRLKRLKPPARR